MNDETKIRREFGKYIVYADKQVGVDFTIYDDDDDKTPLFVGYVKWDGCSNWDFPVSHYPLHFCSKTEAKDLGELLVFMYDWAAEFMPENAEYFTFDDNDDREFNNIQNIVYDSTESITDLKRRDAERKRLTKEIQKVLSDLKRRDSDVLFGQESLM